MRAAAVGASTAIVVAVVVTALTAGGGAALFVPFPAVVVVALVYPWLAHRDSEPTRMIVTAVLTALLLFAGVPWAFAWFGLGGVALPLVVLGLYGYGRAVRAGVDQAMGPTPDSPEPSAGSSR